MRTKNIDKKEVVKAVIDDLTEKKRGVIQTRHFKGFRSPDQIKWRNKGKAYTPDVLAKGIQKEDVFEIVTENHPNPEKIKLFSIYAHARRGECYIVVPRPNVPSIKHFLDSNDIKAKIVEYH